MLQYESPVALWRPPPCPLVSRYAPSPQHNTMRSHRSLRDPDPYSCVPMSLSE
jgi:hypothetical protein